MRVWLTITNSYEVRSATEWAYNSPAADIFRVKKVDCGFLKNKVFRVFLKEVDLEARREEARKSSTYGVFFHSKSILQVPSIFVHTSSFNLFFTNLR